MFTIALRDERLSLTTCVINAAIRLSDDEAR